MALLLKFPERSLEGIKGHRRGPAYKELLQGFLQELRAEQNAPEAAPGTEASYDPTAETLTYLQFLLDQPVQADFQEDLLNSVVANAIHGINFANDLDGYLKTVIGMYHKPMRGMNQQRPADEGEQPIALTSNRRKRRFLYARMQDLYKKNRKEAARKVLDEETESPLFPDIQQFCATWEPIFTLPSTDINISPRTLNLPELWAPMSDEEIEISQKGVSGAPGEDGVPPLLMRKMPIQILTKIFNLLLILRKIPPSISMNRTIFVPKSPVPASPLDFRPLTIPSHFVRLFHKILSKRLSIISLSPAQRGFQTSDGTLENVSLLSAILDDAKAKKRECHMAILDLQKAFDSVSHNAIIECAKVKGVPDHFLSYLRNVYGDTLTAIQSKGRSSHPIKIKRGVRQGDPLSPALFNIVMDSMISNIPTGIGYTLAGNLVSCLAFADDLILVASSRRGLQALLDYACGVLNPYGLIFNIQKCRTISIVPSGREKKIKIVTETSFKIGGVFLKTTGIEEKFKYLGVDFSPTGRPLSTGSMLETTLLRLRKCPLKPQQRLFILRTFALPKFLHRLVLGRTTATQLNSLDLQVRVAVRTWLRLPKDTPIGFLYADVSDGGLGIPSFRWMVPRLKVDRLCGLENHELEIFRALFHELPVQDEIRRAKALTVDNGVCLQTAKQVKNRFKDMLYRSVDGHGLREAYRCGVPHRWISDGTKLLSGNEFIECIKIRINALPTKARTTRGRPARDKTCRAGCRNVETLNHITQTCFRTHGPRVKRHDGLARLVAYNLTCKNWRVEREFVYRTEDGVLKPDIVCMRGNEVRVLEVHVISDSYDMCTYIRPKIDHYRSKDALRVAIGERWNSTNISYHTVTITWRGILDKDSAESLSEMGVSMANLKLYCVRVLQGSLHAWRLFNRMTTQR